MLDAQIFICSGVRELPWLNCSLRSVQRYWSGAYAPIIAIPPECRKSLPSIVNELKCVVILQPVEFHAYLRMTIDCYMSAQMVMFMDVHDMLTKECRCNTFTDAQHRPVLSTEEYSSTLCRPDADNSCVLNRRSLTEDLLDFESPYEYTAREPILFHRHSIRRAREMIEAKNRRPLSDLMRNYCEDYFSVANVVGSYVWQKERSAYHHTPISECTAVPMRQFLGITDPTKGTDFEEVQRILA